MTPKLDLSIISSIRNLRILSFTYEGLERLCEPHIFGVCNGRRQVLCYQLEGNSAQGNLPQWRRFELEKIEGLRKTSRKFPGFRPVPHPHSLGWDQFIAVVTG